jgi:hypothetical protein
MEALYSENSIYEKGHGSQIQALQDNKTWVLT